MVTNTPGLEPEKDCAGQQHTQKTDQSSRQRGRPTKNKTVSVKQISGYKPQMGLDTKTYWLTDRQSQCDFDFSLARSKPSAWGYKRATLFLGDINTGTWPSRLGESRICDIKMS
jgi:hypothetical protein